MNIRSKTFFALSVVAVLSACSPFSVVSDFDQSTGFDSYKTYEIRDNDLEMTDIDKDRVVSAVKNSLNNKGMEESSSPDFVVNLKASHEVIINLRKVSEEKRVLLGGYDPMSLNWGWGGPYGGYWSVRQKYRNSPISYRKGGLVLDFVDVKSQKLIWQGIGSGINIDNRKEKIKQIPNIVNRILKNFPPK